VVVCIADPEYVPKVTGLFAWIMGRRSGNAQVTRSGVIALTWFGLVLIIEAIHQAVG
jgi:hypothetical protein